MTFGTDSHVSFFLATAPATAARLSEPGRFARGKNEQSPLILPISQKAPAALSGFFFARLLWMGSKPPSFSIARRASFGRSLFSGFLFFVCFFLSFFALSSASPPQGSA